MVGHFEVHVCVGVFEVIALVADGSEFLFELVIGHRSGVLELTETVVGDDVEVSIRDHRFEFSAARIRLTVLLACEPAEEIILLIVRQIID